MGDRLRSQRAWAIVRQWRAAWFPVASLVPVRCCVGCAVSLCVVCSEVENGFESRLRVWLIELRISEDTRIE